MTTSIPEITSDELYEMTRGAQTKLTDDFSLYDINNKINFLGHKVLSFNGTSKRHYGENCIAFRLDAKNGYFFYKNLSTNIPKNLIDYVYIEVGGQRVEIVYYDIYDFLQHEFYPNSTDNLVPSTLFHTGIPALCHHETNIKFVLKDVIIDDSPKIFIDMYEVTSKTSDKLVYNESIYNTNTDKEEYHVNQIIRDDQTNFNKNLNLNHPCRFIVIKSEMDPSLLQELDLLLFLRKKQRIYTQS